MACVSVLWWRPFDTTVDLCLEKKKRGKNYGGGGFVGGVGDEVGSGEDLVR